MKKQTMSYGTWPSLITPAVMSANQRLYDAQWDGRTGALVWQVRRTSGSALVVQFPGEAPRDLVRDVRIGGGLLFGGGGFTVGKGRAYYVGESGRVFTVPLRGGIPQAITPAFGAAAAPTLSPDGRWLLYVHSVDEREALVIVPTDGSAYPRKLLDNTDFVMQPAWHPSGDRIACVTWDHPHMPWNETRLEMLYLGSDVEPRVVGRGVVAGASGGESVFGAAFSPDGRWLAYASDREGWWSLYVQDLESGAHHWLTRDEAEYAVPAWLQGMRTFAWGPDGWLYALRTADTRYTLVRVDTTNGTQETVAGLDAYTHLEQLDVHPTSGEVSLIAGATHLPDRLVTVLPDEAGRVRAYTDTNALPDANLARADVISWENADGVTISGLYYPPTNHRYTGGGVPPLIVYIHSGPTRQRFARYFPETHFFTTRGYAVLEPNYRGSTGYGRAFKDMLHGAWGVAEVEDCAVGASLLVERGLADPARMVVFGGSSGGYSVLQSLITRPGFYRAGVAQAPVADQFALALETHKFERHYNDVLLGALPSAAALYRDRSPARHAGAIQDPLALFHGSQDAVVPPDQSAAVAAALRRSGVPHIHRVYDGEGHSFRDPNHVADYYQSTLRFLMKHVIYAP